ncbi:hypothetical protein CEUSTIGMA_g11221.t1 [Chlamydomonas eustigma]|uniref:L-ascorbate peroxidase n=1 Tax=Chlamydomonas eustigma TaxID=1157962 RepID=A0A250XL87_9CHLO|nr:hypothetical protein CEUSTIGMA_g11221.t1 [Chlamydomonas eustigma]|eukprot:GAX83796.1 hypothetical protein CEUSTIGMA_g11221.t1 [Chlamydomonas eustigma]
MLSSCSYRHCTVSRETLSHHASHAYVASANNTQARALHQFQSERVSSPLNFDHIITRPTSSAMSADEISSVASSSRRTLLLGTISFGVISNQCIHPRHAIATSTGLLVMPNAETQAAINAALRKVMNKGKAPSALRLVFHDAGTFNLAKRDGGMNSSIQFELDRPENFGLKRGWRIVLDLEKAVKGTPAEGLVTRTDWIALAGAAAVAMCGGPVIPVAIGRQDALGPDPEGRLPAESLSASELKSNFAAKGFSVRELVALSGAHTIGGKGFGAPDVFDNAYYKSLLARPWLDKTDPMAPMIGLPSDHVLPEDEECLPFIQEFSSSQESFFEAFSLAYLKMTSTGLIV